MTTTTVGAGALIYEAIPAAELDALRLAGRDEAGNPLTVLTDGEGGSPLRCCLREIQPGEDVLLIAYTPPHSHGAYAERGPVFVHAQRCPGYQTEHTYPPGLAHREQVVRGYDHLGRIAAGVRVADGASAELVIAQMLARPDIQAVHLRNVEAGCYNFAVRRG